MKALTSLTLSLLALAGSATIMTANAADAAPDTDLTQAVKAALDAEPSLKGQKISVQAVTNDKGEKEVTLKGVVTDQQLMVTAGHVAEKVPGVKYVMNEIDNEDYLREQAAQKKQ